MNVDIFRTPFEDQIKQIHDKSTLIELDTSEVVTSKSWNRVWISVYLFLTQIIKIVQYTRQLSKYRVRGKRRTYISIFLYILLPVIIRTLCIPGHTINWKQVIYFNCSNTNYRFSDVKEEVIESILQIKYQHLCLRLLIKMPIYNIHTTFYHQV